MDYQGVTDAVILNSLPMPSAAAFPAASDIFDISKGAGMVGADPWTTGIMAGSQLLGSSLASNPKSSADSRFDTSLGFDNSGWNVSIGGGQITSDRTQTPAQNWMVTAGLIVAGLVAWKMYIKKR